MYIYSVRILNQARVMGPFFLVIVVLQNHDVTSLRQHKETVLVLALVAKEPHHFDFAIQIELANWLQPNVSRLVDL